MSSSEIADNKWELEASKPPITSLGSLAQLAIFAGFVLLLGYIVTMSVAAIVTPKKENSLGELYKNMKQDGSAAPVPAPAP